MSEADGSGLTKQSAKTSEVAYDGMGTLLRSWRSDSASASIHRSGGIFLVNHHVDIIIGSSV